VSESFWQHPVNPICLTVCALRQMGARGGEPLDSPDKKHMKETFNMKLKPIIASLCLAGIPSLPATALAGETGDPSANTQALKQLTSLQADLSNNTAPSGNAATGGEAWYKRIQISGFGQFDAKASNHGMNTDVSAGQSSFKGHRSSRLGINAAGLDFDADLTSWSAARLELLYEDGHIRDAVGRTWDDADDPFTLDQAYLTFGNLNVAPVYATVGRQYVDFGQYKHFVVTPEVATSLSQTNATALKVGFDVVGFDGSMSVFRSALRHETGGTVQINSGHNSIQDYAANLQYANDFTDDMFGFKMGASYISNMADVAYIGARLRGGAGDYTYNISHVHGMALHGDVHFGSQKDHWFSASANYVKSIDTFSGNDLRYNTTTRGARPSGLSLEAGYNFYTSSVLPSKVYVGYDHTNESAGLNLPECLWKVGYVFSLDGNTSINLEYARAKDYDVGNVAQAGAGSDTGTVNHEGSFYNAYTARVAYNF